MDELISTRIKSLLDNTQLFLATHTDQAQWSACYPLICNLAEQYLQLYREHPAALQAQLMLYKPHLSYAANLVINQCVITTALCISQRYDNELSTSYISVSLVENLCVSEQLTKLSKQQPFNQRDKKVWQLRHKLAAKVLLSAKHPTQQITQVLAKLIKYKHALVTTPKLMLYDNGSIIVAVANILATNITCNAAKQHINFYKAVGDLYLRTPNLFAQQLLKTLIAHIGAAVPGSRTLYAQQNMVYLATDNEQRHILINTAHKKVHWYRVKAALCDQPVQWLCNDQRILYKVWDTEYVQPHGAENSNPNTLYDLLTRIRLQQEYSYRRLSSLLEPYPQVINRVCQAVTAYNKEGLVAKDLKHSLSMVGYNNAPAIIQRVVFEQLVYAIAHPLQAFLVKRLANMVAILSALVCHNKQHQVEHISLALYAYSYYVFGQCSAQLSRKITINNSQDNTLDTPIAAFFGVEQLDTLALNQHTTSLLNDNPWAGALLDAEQVAKSKLNEPAKLWVAFKAVVQIVFKPTISLTAWQQQILEQQLQAQGWQDKSRFFAKLNTLAIANSI